MNVLLLYAYAVEQADRLAGLLSPRWCVATHHEREPGDDLPAKLAAADVVISPRFPAGLPPTPKLKLIQSPVAGLDKIDPARVPDDCAVCNVFEHEIGVSEFALLAMLEWSIRIAEISARFRAGSWQDGVAALGPTHGELYGKTVGIIGAGHIGSAIAERAQAFGMKTYAITRTAKPHPAFDRVAAAGDLDALLPECDFIVVACPLTEATRGLLDRRRLALCKTSAVIINLARGHVIEEEALYQALKNRSIGGAVIDVWYTYPGPEDERPRPSTYPFHELDNIIMTPHCSSWSEGLLGRRWSVIADNLENLADGKPLRNLVDIKAS